MNIEQLNKIYDKLIINDDVVFDYNMFQSVIFNDSNTITNGEKMFYENMIKNTTKCIFDVGSSNSSGYLDFQGTVHYFEPIKHLLDELKLLPNSNSYSFFNNFGLSYNNEKLYYYPRFDSFLNRIKSLNIDDSENKSIAEVKPAREYIINNCVYEIDFLKIDTEGFEFNVIRGFEEFIQLVKVLQFEYGGCYIDSGVKLIDVIEHLRGFGFDKFCYITRFGLLPMTDFTDNYQYCNIACIRSPEIDIDTEYR